MKKVLSKYKKQILISLSFLIPFFTLIITFFLKGFFKDNSIMNSDMFLQYFPLFNYLKDFLSGTKDLFYNFNYK